MSDANNAPKGAAELTAQANAAASEIMSFDDEADFERAQRGLIATLPGGTVMVDDLGLHARVEAQPGYFAGRSGRGRIEVEIIAPAGDVTIRESWIW